MLTLSVYSVALSFTAEENNLEEAAIGFQKSIDHQATAVCVALARACPLALRHVQRLGLSL